MDPRLREDDGVEAYRRWQNSHLFALASEPTNTLYALANEPMDNFFQSTRNINVAANGSLVTNKFANHAQ
jgi:hypothetical protein